MLVKMVQTFFPSIRFEGFIATESIDITFRDISTVKRINAKTFTRIKIVFKLKELRILFLFSILYA
jgi:hypothetical protein